MRGYNAYINMLFEYAERPPPVFMTQSIHILKGGTHTHTCTRARALAHA